MITVFAPFDLAYMEQLCDKLWFAKNEQEATDIVDEMRYTIEQGEFEKTLDKRCPQYVWWIIDNLTVYAGDKFMTSIYLSKLEYELKQWSVESNTETVDGKA